MAKVTVNTVFFYPDAKNKDEEAELLESPVKELTLNLDDKFILAIGPHIPDCAKAFQIYDAFGLKQGSDGVLGNNTIKLRKVNSRQMSVYDVLFQSKLLGRDKPKEDVVIDSKLKLGVSFFFSKRA